MPASLAEIENSAGRLSAWRGRRRLFAAFLVCTIGLAIFVRMRCRPGPAPVLSFRASELRVYLVRFSPDGSVLGTLEPAWNSEGVYEPSAILWEASTGRFIRSMPNADRPDWLRHVPARSRDGTLGAEPVESGGYHNQSVRVFDTATNATIATFEAHRDRLQDIAIAPDGRLLVTGGGYGDHPFPVNPTGEARIWNPRTGQLLGRLRRHWGAVLAVDISPDGKTLATCSDDGTVKLWTLARYDVP